MPAMTKKREDWPRLLRAIQDRTGKRQGELAEVLGVSVHTWRSWLYGQSVPSGPAAKLIKILFKNVK
jgi:DNA-binding transcriptional regulator YiaG